MILRVLAVVVAILTGASVGYAGPGDVYVEDQLVVGSTDASGSLKADIEGPIGATAYCDENGNYCKSIDNIQRTLVENCFGQVMVAINPDGTVECEPVDTDTHIPEGLYGYCRHTFDLDQNKFVNCQNAKSPAACSGGECSCQGPYSMVTIGDIGALDVVACYKN